MADSKRYSTPRQTCVMDEECYVNWWAIAFTDVVTRKLIARFEMFNDSPLDVKGIARIFKHWRVATFNGYGYDMPMLSLAMRHGTTNGDLKKASDGIILADIKPWQFFELHGTSLPEWIDQVDLMEVSPGSPQKPSLKQYGGRLHSRRIQELPIPIDKRITNEERLQLIEYHDNDLETTIDLYWELKAQLDIRCEISDQYNVDVRSKSDAQIAEAIIVAEVERENKARVWRPEVKPFTFPYQPPKWVRFQTPVLQDIFHKLTTIPFVVFGDGSVQNPSFLDAGIKIGNSVYQMGIGGLHSTESCAFHESDDEFVLLDRDVTSFYPWLIILMGMFPKHMGKATLKVLRSILERRVAAKRSGDKNLAETLKIVVNGFFGKTGSRYSKIYAPHMMVHTTITGQLAILMLIEEVELRGMQVVSANTDGFVTKVPRARQAEFEAVLLDWQWDTGLNTEETEYRSLHSRDVNNYIAIIEREEKKVYPEGKVKTKGALSKGGPGLPGAMGMKKNPDREICIDAVINYLKDGKPLSETIYESRDIRQFISIRKVKGGAVDQDGVMLGKTVRFYYARGVQGQFTYLSNGNAVPKSEGAKEAMELPSEFPDDVDHNWYVREAVALLQDIGHTVIDPALKGRSGYVLGNMDDQKTYHYVKLPEGVAACGKAPESIRDPWGEIGSHEGQRICSKCRKAMEL